MCSYNFDKANGIIFMYDITYGPLLTDIKSVLNSIDKY